MAATGAILVATGIALEGQGVGGGAAVRTLGGILLLAGLGVLLFGEPRRRAASIEGAKHMVARYMAATGHWRWPNRVGVAGMAVGLLLLVPALIVQILFGTLFATAIIAPGIVCFWAGLAMVVYARFRRGAAGPRHAAPPARPGRRRWR